MISPDCGDTLMASAGHRAVAALDEAMEKYRGDSILAVEGNLPLDQHGISNVLVAYNEPGVSGETNAARCELVGRSDAELAGTPVVTLMADAVSVERLRSEMETPAGRRMGHVFACPPEG